MTPGKITAKTCPLTRANSIYLMKISNISKTGKICHRESVNKGEKSQVGDCDILRGAAMQGKHHSSVLKKGIRVLAVGMAKNKRGQLLIKFKNKKHLEKLNFNPIQARLFYHLKVFALETP